MFITIDRINHNGMILIKSDNDDFYTKYLFCNEKKALQLYRQQNNLKYKHLNIIRLYK